MSIDLLKAKFIALPEKPDALECKDDSTVSLRKNMVKPLLGIIEESKKQGRTISL